MSSFTDINDDGLLLAAASPVVCSGVPSSGTLESDVLLALRRLAVSSPFLESNRLRSDGRLDLTVPPSMFSRATDVNAEALFDVLGHDPYQLLALRTWCSVLACNVLKKGVRTCF